MIEHCVDVLLIRGYESRIGKEVLRVLLLFPGKILPDSAQIAGCTISHERNDKPHAVLPRRLDRVVRDLKGRRIELPLFRLDAKLAAHRVTQRLRPHDLGAHLFGCRKRVIDFKVAWIAWPLGIVRAISFQSKPLDIWSAIAKCRARKSQLCSGAFHKIRAGARLRNGPMVPHQSNYNQRYKSRKYRCEVRDTNQFHKALAKQSEYIAFDHDRILAFHRRRRTRGAKPGLLNAAADWLTRRCPRRGR